MLHPFQDMYAPEEHTEEDVIEALQTRTAAYISQHPELGIPIPITITEENLDQSIQNVKSKIESLYDIKEKVEKEGILGLSEKELGLLEEYGIGIEEIQNMDFSELEDEIKKWIDAIREINPAWADALQAFFDTGGAVDEVKSAVEQTDDAMSTLESDMRMLSDAWSEFNSNGQISTDTAYQMAQAGYGAALSIDQ